MTSADTQRCDRADLLALYALDALAPGTAEELEIHFRGCAVCREELEELRRVVERFAGWPSDDVRPPASLQERLARRIADEVGGAIVPPPPPTYQAPAWEEVAPGIACKILSEDTKRDRVTLLVRLLPETSYPAHTHAGVEELHLLDGELWIEDRRLYPGDYNYGAPGHTDHRVYSETGCTCVLITSPSDVLR